MSQNASRPIVPTHDSIRQWVVLVSLVIAIGGSLIGSGALGGTPIGEAAGGALSADATRIAPAVPAFSIWSVIYLGLAIYAVWQLLPAHKSDPRQRRLGYSMAASLVLNAAWILSVQAGLLALSAVMIVLLLAVLAYAFRLCIITRPSNVMEAIAVDGVVGLYLGWVCGATVANITARLTGEPHSVPTAIAALATVTVVMGVTVVCRLRVPAGVSA
ncbi:MAG: TspO/MBR family protein [Lacisediminihabitans sp.]